MLLEDKRHRKDANVLEGTKYVCSILGLVSEWKKLNTENSGINLWALTYCKAQSKGRTLKCCRQQVLPPDYSNRVFTAPYMACI